MGFETSDDAAVYRLAENQAVVSTADLITPPVDDARTFGRIAAANALSDVYAMGARPIMALSLVGFPSKKLDAVVLLDMISGLQEMVEEDSYVQKGTILVKIEDTSAVEVRCNLRMDDLYWLWSQSAADANEPTGSPTRDYQIPRAPVTVSYELAGRRYLWDGVLSRFDGIGVDERTRTVPCRVLVDHPRKVRLDGSDDASGRPVGPPALVRGMYVTVSVHAQPRMTLLEIPQQAVQPGNRVWQVIDGRLSIRRIRVADSADDVVLVYAEASGLKPGMKLVSSPLALAIDGMAFRERAKE